MKRLLAVGLLLGPLVAGAQVISATPPADQPPAPQPQGVPPPPPATPPPPSSAPQLQAPPPLSGDQYAAPGPDEPYAPPPSSEYVPPPSASEVMPPSVAVAPPSGTGQWVDTAQYGWVWMPYGTAYTFLPAGAYPDMYVYVPVYGWRWVVAPWVWGIGPRPYSVYGWARFPWWGRGYGRWYGFRGAPVWAGRGWGRPGWSGPAPDPAVPGGVVRPAPHVSAPHPGVVVRRPGGFARSGRFGRR